MKVGNSYGVLLQADQVTNDGKVDKEHNWTEVTVVMLIVVLSLVLSMVLAMMLTSVLSVVGSD